MHTGICTLHHTSAHRTQPSRRAVWSPSLHCGPPFEAQHWQEPHTASQTAQSPLTCLDTCQLNALARRDTRRTGVCEAIAYHIVDVQIALQRLGFGHVRRQARGEQGNFDAVYGPGERGEVRNSNGAFPLYLGRHAEVGGSGQATGKPRKRHSPSLLTVRYIISKMAESG